MKNKKLSEKQFKERFYALLENVKTGYGLNGSFVKPFRTTENSLDDLEATEKCFGAHDEEYSKGDGLNDLWSIYETCRAHDYTRTRIGFQERNFQYSGISGTDGIAILFLISFRMYENFTSQAAG